jgi:serine/threonine protein kinase
MGLPGTTLLGKYKITGLLGEGGMSFVYQARDLESCRDVAVKIMKSNLTSTYFDDLIRFKREIDIVSRLNHPGVVRVYETGEYENLPFLVMELLPGQSLADLLRSNYRFRIDETLEIVQQLAEILDYVHSRSIIHRDLKPANIFINNSVEKREVKIIDFGLSFLLELKAIRDERQITGTFGYMSPEATGILKRRVDERSDLYSVGVIFYQLLAGAPPFNAAEARELIHQQTALTPQKIRTFNPLIPETLERIVMKLLMKDPDLRYQSAQGLLSDLKRCDRGEADFIIGEKDPAVKLSFQSSLVGRDNEFNKLVELFNQARNNQGSICLIAGEPGIGKSRLIEDFGLFVSAQKGLFVHGKCFYYQSKTPYQPFKDIIDDYLR